MTDKRINKYFALAKNASEFSDFNRVHIGCVIVHKNRVLSVGWNSNRTSPSQKRYNAERNFDPNESGVKNSLHSEVHALSRLKGCGEDLSRASIFVYRAYKDGSNALSKPCAACRKAIKDAGIKNIYFTTLDGWAHERIE